MSQGYKIEFRIAELADSVLLLGNYYGGRTYVKDTASNEINGRFAFQGAEKLERGMYFVILNNAKLFDFVVGEDQFFSMETAQPDYIRNMRVEGDIDNKLFYENMLFNLERNQEVNPFITVLQDSTSSENERSEAQAAFEEINLKVEENTEEIRRAYPTTVMAAILGIQKRLKVPATIAARNESDSDEWKYDYFRAHFWDDIDLGDPALLRLPSPMYKQKVDEYLDKLIVPIPDSIIAVIDKLAIEAERDEETFKYFVWHVIGKYQRTNILGFDKIYVHLYDTYFASGKMDYWANEQLKSSLRDRADQLRNSLVGMTAPNLILQDDRQQAKALHDLANKYTVIYFYDPDCGHCKEETPVLREFIETSKFDVGVYSVSADTSIAKMQKYIDEMGLSKWVNTNGPRTYGLKYQEVYDAYTTPTIYVLDEKKKILAKKLQASQLEDFLRQHEERN